MGRLDGKVALITGGNSGIGYGAAEVFLREGAEVVITGRNEETLKTAAETLGANALAVRGDVSDVEHLTDLARIIDEKFGRLDIVFANAGIALPVPLAEVTEEHFDVQFNINVKGLLFTVQKMLPLLVDGSSIILNASIVKDRGFSGFTVYSATKAAVRSFVRTWANELSERKIRVNSISPGPIETPIFDRMGMTKEEQKEFGEGITEQVPLGTFGKPEDIAEAALYLASDESKFTNGIDLVVDGGLTQV